MIKIRIKKKNFIKLMSALLILSIVIIIFIKVLDKKVFPNLNNMTVEQIENLSKRYNLKLNIKYQYSNDIAKDNIISQNIKKGEKIIKGSVLNIIISKGKIPLSDYQNNKINELGRVPIMMYHNITNGESKSVGGNIDEDGYNRTSAAFKQDLENYFNSGYEMIRLIDYINGNINTSFGKSPIILTFDDGNSNNIKVTGLDKNGDIIIDKESAVGILEAFKKTHPDTVVTATFFVNEELFHQSKYNEKILAWLIEHGYDIGNHTMTHADISKITTKDTESEVGGLYNLLDQYIKGKYINVVALPYGSPYKDTHDNFKYILESNYNNIVYKTIATLRVGWEADYSPFNQTFNQNFIKRIRAYDNNGKDFDITMSLEKIKDTRYISDGDSSTIVIPSSLSSQVNNKINLEVIEY